ncbi:hypothetical protein D9M68_933400 [compost metagenome]
MLGQQLGGGGLPHTQHEQVVEVADHLAGLGAIAEARLDIAQRLGVGGDLHTRAAALVDEWDEFITHELVELVGVDIDGQLGPAHGAGEAVINAELVDVAGD